MDTLNYQPTPNSGGRPPKRRPQSAKVYIKGKKQYPKRPQRRPIIPKKSRPESAQVPRQHAMSQRSIAYSQLYSGSELPNLGILESNMDHNNKVSQFLSIGNMARGSMEQKDPGLSSFLDFSKIGKPKNIKKDKEQLYSDNLGLKKKNNKLNIENRMLKTQLQTSEVEMRKIYQLLENQNNSSTGKFSAGRISETHLVMNLKRQLKNEKSQIKKFKQQLQDIKRNIKQTKIKELQVQLNSFVSETIRLKDKLDYLNNKRQEEILKLENYNAMDEKYQHQCQISQSLQQQKEELESYVEQLQYQSEQLQFEYERAQRAIGQQQEQVKRENAKIMGMLKKRNNQVKKLSKDKKALEEEVAEQKQLIEKLQKSSSKFLETQEELIQTREELEKTTKELEEEKVKSKEIAEEISSMQSQMDVRVQGKDRQIRTLRNELQSTKEKHNEQLRLNEKNIQIQTQNLQEKFNTKNKQLNKMVRKLKQERDNWMNQCKQQSQIGGGLTYNQQNANQKMFQMQDKIDELEQYLNKYEKKIIRQKNTIAELTARLENAAIEFKDRENQLIHEIQEVKDASPIIVRKKPEGTKQETSSQRDPGEKKESGQEGDQPPIDVEVEASGKKEERDPDSPNPEEEKEEQKDTVDVDVEETYGTDQFDDSKQVSKKSSKGQGLSRTQNYDDDDFDNSKSLAGGTRGNLTKSKIVDETNYDDDKFDNTQSRNQTQNMTNFDDDKFDDTRNMSQSNVLPKEESEMVQSYYSESQSKSRRNQSKNMSNTYGQEKFEDTYKEEEEDEDFRSQGQSQSQQSGMPSQMSYSRNNQAQSGEGSEPTGSFDMSDGNYGLNVVSDEDDDSYQ